MKYLVRILGVALLLGAAVTTSFAGGPLYVYDVNQPYAWNLDTWGGAVPVYTDLGALGRLSNTRANELTGNAWAQWNGVASSDFVAAVAGPIPLGDITAVNITSIIGTDNGGGIHVVYDNDGNILRNFFGVSPTSVLGVANVELVSTSSPEIHESWVVLSGPAVRSSDPNGIGFAGVMTHEFGHTINLGHSQANGATLQNSDAPNARDCAAPWTGKPGVTQHETMYPFTNPVPGGTGEYAFSVDRTDDIAAVSNLYPAPGWPGSWGTIRGTITALHRAQGGTEHNEYEVGSVNVIARRVGDPFNDASSYISGQLSRGAAGPDGSFELNGLTPGQDYVLYVDNLLSGAFSVPRLLVLPGPEEYYNGVNESGDGMTDDRCAWTTIRVAAGSPVTANLTLNRVKGAPEFLPQPVTGTPTDITPDGSIVVGAVGAPAIAYRWTLADNSVLALGGFATGGSAGISDDGTKVGFSERGPDGVVTPAIWENGVWTILPKVPGSTTPCNTGGANSWGSTYDISGDGSTVVGLAWTAGCATAGADAFRWTAASGTGRLPKSPDSPTRANRANAVNYDGTVIAGWDDHTTGFRRGAYWTAEPDGTFQTVHVVGTNPVLPVGEALDVTDDGTQIVGLNANQPDFTTRAWRYTENEGIETFPRLGGTSQGAANLINADGSVIAGWSQTPPPFTSRTPTLWTASLGTFDFNQFMNAQGTYAQDILIANATAMSADGTVITGWANTIFGTVGWVLRSPKVVLCHAPPTNPSNAHTIDVTFPGGLDEHLAHGDTLGLCQHGGV